MPLIPDDREINMALQLAAQSPFEGPDPGFIERFKADVAAMQGFSNSNADHRNALEVQAEFQTQFYKASGQRLGGWVDDMTYNAMDRAKKQFEQWKADNPDSGLEFPTPDALRRRADEKAALARRRSEDLARRSTSWSSSAGGFTGTVGGSLSDPVNLMAMGFGAGPSAGIVRTALVEGALGIISEAAIQGMTLARKQRIDPSFGADDALYEVAAAGVGGAALGSGFKALANVWHRAKTGQWPSHIRDAANVVTREAAVPPSRFERSMRGETAHQAALSKSLDDLARGRPVELPPEAFLEAGARPGRVYDADGRSVGVRYEVVEADDLITSQLDNMQANPAFPPDLQPRDRSRAISQDQIAGIAGNLQPERLGFSPDASTGAPIVGPDGLVESGNGRVLALRRALQEGGVAADNYRNYLRSQNFDIDGFRNPVLVARRITDLEDRVAFVTAANRSTTLRMGAAEQAMADARLLDGDLLERLSGSDITSADNQAFARGFMGRLPRAEQGNLVDKDGFLSQEGQRRMTAALMGRAYGEPVLLGRALEDTDNNIRSIAGALSDSSAPWARMRDAVARGEIPAGMDITDDLMNAVQLVMRARDEGRAVRDLVNQAEMFGGPDELSKIIARALFSDADMKRPISRQKLASFLDDYAREAMKNDAGPRLFGEALSAPDILKGSLERVGRNDLYQLAEERLSTEAIERLGDDPAVAEASIMDGERLIADREEAVNRQTRWDREWARLASEKTGEIKNALYHRDIGPIDVVWGEYDPAKPNSGFGLAKIMQKHPEVLEALPRIIEGLNVKTRSNNRIRLESPDHRAVVSLDMHGEDKAWLITAFEIDRSAGETVDRPGGLQVDGHSSSTSPAEPNILQGLPTDKAKPIRIDLGDGRGLRDFDEVMREADDEIAAAAEIESCAVGRSPNAE